MLIKNHRISKPTIPVYLLISEQPLNTFVPSSRHVSNDPPPLHNATRGGVSDGAIYLEGSLSFENSTCGFFLGQILAATTQSKFTQHLNLTFSSFSVFDNTHNGSWTKPTQSFLKRPQNCVNNNSKLLILSEQLSS